MENQDPGPLPTFRAEAVAHRARRQGPGELIRLAPAWTKWAFYLAVGLFAVALVAASVVRIDRTVAGTATVDSSGRVVILVPASLVPGVPKGNAVAVGERSAEVVRFEGTVLYPRRVKRLFGVEVSVPSVVVVTSVRREPPRRPGAVRTRPARVLISSEPLIVALVPGLDALLGEGDG